MQQHLTFVDWAKLISFLLTNERTNIIIIAGQNRDLDAQSEIQTHKRLYSTDTAT